MKARFRVFLGGDRYADEDALVAHRVELSHRGTLKGQIEISNNESQCVSVEDELFPLVLGLCFRAVAQLTHCDHAVVTYSNTYGYLRLDREADLIRISGDGVSIARFPEAAMLQALLECGARFSRWVATTTLPREANTESARALAVAEASARDALCHRSADRRRQGTSHGQEPRP